ncbi:unnamed protein product, partial [Pylaiella littoralis]
RIPCLLDFEVQDLVCSGFLLASASVLALALFAAFRLFRSRNALLPPIIALHCVCRQCCYDFLVSLPPSGLRFLSFALRLPLLCCLVSCLPSWLPLPSSHCPADLVCCFRAFVLLSFFVCLLG